MSLSVYVRHYPPCPQTDIHYKRCKCPKWIQGVFDPDKPPLRQSEKTRSWERAEQTCRRLEQEFEKARETGKPVPQRITLEHAVHAFISAKRDEALRESTIEKLRTIFEKQFLIWAKAAAIDYLDEIADTHLEAFRASWNVQALARRKKQERLVTFFYYCQRKKWISENPAKLLGRVKVEEKPTDYFPADEFTKIIDATYIYNPKAWHTEPRNQATRVRTLILMMRWSGLAISDAVSLERTRLTDKNEIFLRAPKPDSQSTSPSRPTLPARYAIFQMARRRTRGIFFGAAMAS
jgi:integrase/recombinase XerD